MNGVDDTPGAGRTSAFGQQLANAEGRRVWFAPGPRAGELAALLAALAPGSCGTLSDLYELPPAPDNAASADSLVVDADHLALEDIGWIRRQLALGRLREVVAVGIDPGSAVARALRGLPSARWSPWPPDIEELKRWRPREAAAVSSAAGGSPSAPSARQPAPAHSSAARQDAPPPTGMAPAERTALALGRDQVAVLADISQRLELAFLALREAGRGQSSELESAQVELRRLLRFTRSLACLAAPPPRGDDEFDVAGLLEELLATLTLRGRTGPRFQPATGGGGRPTVEFIARADRAAITMALETVLTLARLCASGGDTVRVSYAPLNGSALSIAVDFPAGPLHDVEPGRVLDASLLRERLPELDPSELAAATAIFRSQGGLLEFAAADDGQLSARVRLPLERTPRRSKQAARADAERSALRPAEPGAARSSARAVTAESADADEGAARAARGRARGDDPFA